MAADREECQVTPDEVRALQADFEALERECPHHPDLDALRKQLRLAYLQLGVQQYRSNDHAA